MPPAAIASQLWYTDRSRFEQGTARCPRARYLGYHAGDTGYGLAARRDSLPLATGIAVHQLVERIAAILQTEDRRPTLDEARALISDVVDTYITRVTERGFRGILSGPAVEETIREQATLISGLGWVLLMKFVPWLHQQYRVVASEQEHLHFLECSCGAPPLDADEHLRRGCTGKALMQRVDLLAQRRSGGQSLAYFEFKTTGWDSDAWAEQWETKAQLALGAVDAVARYGAEVTELFVVGLSKGGRRKDRFNPDDIRRQSTALCYGYCRPGNPPMAPDDWLPGYEWTNNEGEVKRASRAHRRKGVWELGGSDWPVWQAYRGSDPAMSPEEFWVRNLPNSLTDKICFTLGPMNPQQDQLGMLLRGMAGEEDRWQGALWQLYELQRDGYTWSSAVFQSALDRVIPCSWNCRPFGREHQCEFVPICHRHTGWDDPIGSGQYQPRLPHHEPELQQAIARGLLPADAALVEEED